jgi:hypothetical protein
LRGENVGWRNRRAIKLERRSRLQGGKGGVRAWRQHVTVRGMANVAGVRVSGLVLVDERAAGSEIQQYQRGSDGKDAPGEAVFVLARTSHYENGARRAKFRA